MAFDAPVRTAKFKQTSWYSDSLTEFKKQYPNLTDKIDYFKKFKKSRPAESLPNRFKDHMLQGGWNTAGVCECHLDLNACLLYIDKKDTVTLIAIVQHDDLEMRRVQRVGRRAVRLAEGLGLT